MLYFAKEDFAIWRAVIGQLASVYKRRMMEVIKLSYIFK